MNVWSRVMRGLGTMVVVTVMMAMTMVDADAKPVIFTNEAEFDAALAANGLTTATESFEGVSPGIHFDLDFGAFTAPSVFLNFVSDDPADASDGTSSLVVLPPTFLPTFSFARPIRAFSLDIIGALDTGENNELFVAVGDQTDTVFNGQFPSGHVQFVGILDTVLPFTELTFFSSGFPDFFTIDRVRFEDVDATAVPEPASLTLLGLGLLAARHRLRRGRRLSE